MRFGEFVSSVARRARGGHLLGDVREALWQGHVVGSMSRVDGVINAAAGPRALHISISIELVDRGSSHDKLCLAAAPLEAFEQSCHAAGAGAVGIDLPHSRYGVIHDLAALTADHAIFLLAYATVIEHPTTKTLHFARPAETRGSRR